MLFPYPIAATAENWLHECISSAIEKIHADLASGHQPPGWPEILPDQYRAKLSSRRGLRDRLAAYGHAVALLTQPERDIVLRAQSEQNEIASLLAAQTNCATLEQLPAAVHQPLRELYEFAFGLLSDLGIRDRQYAFLHDRLVYRTCPFCACEPFSAPGGARESLDHYLPESRYPFAGVNLRNLAPMGHACNTQYKRATDVMYKADGVRRKAYNPYDAPGIQISLDTSEANSGLDGPLISTWRIEFSENSEEAETWDTIFSIRQRYARDVLSVCFNDWLSEFSAFCRAANRFDTSVDQVLESIERYIGFWDEFGLNDRAFLRAATFRMLLKHCRQGQRFVLGVMTDLVAMGATG